METRTCFSVSDVAQAYESNPHTTNNRSSILSEALRALQKLHRVSQESINLQPVETLPMPVYTIQGDTYYIAGQCYRVSF